MARLRLYPPAEPGEPERGEDILVGAFTFAGQRLDAPAIAQVPAEAGPDWLEAFHGFGWLADLAALGTDPARVRGGEYVADWIAAHRRWDPLAWRADVLGARLCAWLRAAEVLCGGEPRALEHDALVAAIARQARHLARVATREVRDHRVFPALKGLVFAALCLEGWDRERAAAVKALEAETARQVNPDGGHVERNPERQLAVLRDLIEIRDLLAVAAPPVPEWLQGAIDRMVPMARGLRHGDGRLALFNGAREGRRDAVDRVLAMAGARGKPLANAPHTGFQRLAAGRTLVILDAGAPPAPGFDARAHAGALSFEMSVGRERLVVNCGAPTRRDGRWASLLRASAAHSTVTVEDFNSCEILRDGTIGRRPSDIVAARREVEGNLLVEAVHDGYKGPFGITHARSLYLSPDGEDLRGEDVIDGPGSRVFAVRFHLHPAVQASMVQWGKGALLRLPGGMGWRFRATGGTLRLEESVYFGDGEPKRTEQIVVLGRLEGPGTGIVKWRFAAITT